MNQLNYFVLNLMGDLEMMRLKHGRLAACLELMDFLAMQEKVKLVVEGVYSAKAGLSLEEQFHFPVPIIREVNRVLFEGKEPKTAVNDLMLRHKTEESTEADWDH